MDTWKLKTVMNNGEISEVFTNFPELEERGFKNVLETEEVVFMYNPYYKNVDAFYIDKTENEN